MYKGVTESGKVVYGMPCVLYVNTYKSDKIALVSSIEIEELDNCTDHAVYEIVEKDTLEKVGPCKYTNVETAKRLGIDLENPCADGKTFPVPEWEVE